MTDIEGSTDLHTRLGDEAARELVRRQEVHVRTALAVNGGHEVKTMGDGFLAYFTSTRRAIECAIAIQRRISEEDSVRVRIGLHCGEVIHEDGDIHGAAVAAAARIMSQAAGGEIVVSDLVRQLAGAAGVQFKRRGSVALKGLEGQWLLHEVEWREGAASSDPSVQNESRASAGAGLPPTLTTFVGRGEDCRMIAKRLGEARLVMLKGPGGVGKTRLAIEAAAAAANSFDGGVWFADLTTATDAQSVVRVVATMLGVADEPGRSLVDSVVERLRYASALIVFDNCEQVLDAVAELVTNVLGAAPSARVLATSREALGLPGEVVVAVEPLDIPALIDDTTTSLVDCDAVRLFVDRASMVNAAFSLRDDNAPAVASVCRRLDGIPLAIELAAAQLDVLEPSQLDALLEDRFAVLRSSGRGRQPRHRTLEAMLASSYDALDAVDRATMNRLAVFRGTFALDAARAVVVGGLVAAADVLEATSALVRKSLVVTVESAGERRYRLLETVREYAWQQLANAGELDEFRDRHFRWVLALASNAADGLAGSEQVEWLNALDHDLDNIETALEWSLGDAGRAAEALQAVLGLYGYWLARGTHRLQGIHWSEATAAAATSLDPAARTQALMNGALLVMFNDLASAGALAEAARRLAGNDERAAAYATVAATFVAATRGEQVDLAPIERAVDLLADDSGSLQWARAAVSWAMALHGDFVEAHRQLLDVAGDLRDLGDRHLYGAWLSFGADFAFAAGDMGAARSEAFESLDIAREVACVSCESQALSSVVLLGDSDDRGGAVGRARRAVELAAGIRETFNVIEGMNVLVAALASDGQMASGVMLAAATSSLRTATGFASAMPGRQIFATEGLDLARRSMDEHAFDELWRTGSELTYDRALTLALR
jgi:predicted ATPase